jgi:hypothetical protein
MSSVTPILCYHPPSGIPSFPSPPPPPFPGLDLSDFARLSLPNVFQQVNTFSGIRMGDSQILTVLDSPYNLLSTDCMILVDCTGGDVVVNLPFATGSNQFYRIRKIDTTDNVLTVNAKSGETINMDPSVAISEYRRGVVIEDGMPQFWDLIAPASLTDEFFSVTTFNGVRFVPKTITDNYTVQSTDTFILVDCSVLDKDIDVFLPVSVASGQWLHIKKIDSSLRLVRVKAQLGDFIDDADTVNLSGKYADVVLSDDAPNYWNNWGPTFDNVVLIPDPPPARPTTLNECINLFVFYGMCL